MRKTLKLITLILCLASVFSLFALAVFADNTTDDQFGGKTVKSFLLTNKTLCKTEYTEGEYFDPTGLYGIAFFAEGGSTLIPAEDLIYLETGELTTDITSITFVCSGFTTTLDIVVTPNPFASQIAYIELTPLKTDYLAFDILSASDFEVKAIRSDGTVEIIDSSLCSFYPELGEPLSSSDKKVRVTYNNGSSEYAAETDINVQPVLSYEFNGADTAYLYEGLTPDAPRGLSVTVYFDEARTISKTLNTFDITYHTDVIRGNELGKTTIGIIIDTETVDFELDVLPISGYKITGLKEVYYYGDEIALDQVRAYATYSDGATINITSEITIEAPAVAVFGSKISAFHNGFDLMDFLGTSLPEGTLTVINQPNKIKYEIGEMFDSTGLSLAIEYSDGHRVLLLPAEYELTFPIPLTSENKTITAEYYGAKTNISVSVGDEAYIVKLELIGSPSVLDYFEGRLLNTSGLIIEAYLSDGSKIIVNPQTLNFTPSLDTPLTPDITEIIISANDGTENYCYCSYPITVIKRTPTALIATSQPNKLVYIEGEKFDPDGLALNLIFNDMSSIVPASFSFSPELGSAIVLHSNATEKYIIYAIYEYEGTSFSYPIEITVAPADVEKLLVSRDPSKTVYNIGDTVEIEGLELILIYKDRAIASAQVPVGYYAYSPSVITKDTKEISVSFRGITVSIPISVNGIDTVPPVTTDPVPPETSEPAETTLPSDESSTDETTAEPIVTTEPETTETEVTTSPETTASPEASTTGDEETTTPNTGDKDKAPSLLTLWIIVIVVIIAALIALIIYYKKNFT